MSEMIFFFSYLFRECGHIENWFAGWDILELKQGFKGRIKPISTIEQVHADGGPDV